MNTYSLMNKHFNLVYGVYNLCILDYIIYPLLSHISHCRVGSKVARLSRLLLDTLKILPLVNVMMNLLNFDRHLFAVVVKRTPVSTSRDPEYAPSVEVTRPTSCVTS